MDGRAKGKVKLGLLLKYLKMWFVCFVYDYLWMDGRPRYPNVSPILPCLRVPRVMQAIQGSLKDIQKAGQGEFICDRNFKPKKWLHFLPREVFFWLTNLSCFTHQPSPQQERLNHLINEPSTDPQLIFVGCNFWLLKCFAGSQRLAFDEFLGVSEGKWWRRMNLDGIALHRMFFHESEKSKNHILIGRWCKGRPKGARNSEFFYIFFRGWFRLVQDSQCAESYQKCR